MFLKNLFVCLGKFNILGNFRTGVVKLPCLMVSTSLFWNLSCYISRRMTINTKSTLQRKYHFGMKPCLLRVDGVRLGFIILAESN